MHSFFIILFRKMIKNRWLVLSQFFGVLVIASILSSIPAYTNGVLQRILQKELQDFQIKTSKYPGSVGISVSSAYNTTEWDISRYKDVEKLYNELPYLIPLPEISKTKFITNEYFYINMPLKEGQKEPEKLFFRLSAIYGMQDHIDIIDGRLPAAKNVSTGTGIPLYETLVSEQLLEELNLVSGKEYMVEDIITDSKARFRIIIVGVFRIKEENDPFWTDGAGSRATDIFMDYDLYLKDLFISGDTPYCKFDWRYYFDYNKLKIEKAGEILNQDKLISETITTLGKDIRYVFPIRDILKGYYEKMSTIRIIMLSINMPLLFMLALFILMLSLLKIGRESNEISIASSRGAGKLQISAIYLVESLIIAIFALASGPVLGIILARFVGASTGFMDFVSRSRLDIRLVPDNYLYAFFGVLFSVFLTTIPAYANSAISVVAKKRAISRSVRKPLWQKVYLDLILLVVSGYGIYVFDRRQRELLATGLTAKSLEIDPLLFIVPALFMISLGFLFIRLYPLLVGLLFKAGKSFWSPGIYASLLQTSRSISQYSFLSLFLMFTISLGIYSANSVRTINMNAEDKIRYSIAADIVIEPVWKIYQSPGDSGPGSIDSKGPTANLTNIFGKKEYIVPNYDMFTKLKGVETATKVYTTNRCEISGKENNYSAEMMAVTTDEFGIVAWFRNDLLRYHWYNYLNLIAQDPSAILISSSLAVESGLKPGDSVYISWGDAGYARFTVYAIIDYWPSWNPNGKVVEATENGRIIQKQLPKPMLVVANFQYVYDRMSTEPWNIWIKLKPGATTADLYNDITDKKLDISTIKNMREELIKFKTDPFQMGINGAMTISFCITLLICLIGFIFFWILSIRSRELQFGIFRAIGLQTRSISVMLVLEQILISGISVLAGSFIGIITTKVFIRFFNLAYSSFEQVPPFKIVTELQDYTRLYIFIAVMLFIGLGVLSLFVSRIKTAQALKLGED